jgi:hypothetical protein
LEVVYLLEMRRDEFRYGDGVIGFLKTSAWWIGRSAGRWQQNLGFADIILGIEQRSARSTHAALAEVRDPSIRSSGTRADSEGSSILATNFPYSAGCQEFSCHQEATESRLPRNMLRSAFLMLAMFFG